jgi:D-alanyl-D-alanine endopeptidase (penicillin-binding protein 7)
MIALRNLFVILIISAAILFIGLVSFNYYQLYTASRHTPPPAIPTQDQISPEIDIPVTVDSEFIEIPPVIIEPVSPPIVIQRPPTLYPKAYLVGNIKTGEIYLERNSNAVLPVASMSKLVTAFVATDILKLTDVISITEHTASTAPDKSNLIAGEKFSLKEILDPLLLSSSNVAAESIASSTDRIAFMKEMRSYSWEVGMPHSYFADPSGISSRNVASAHDMFGLAQYLYKFRPDILAITRIGTTSIATTTEHGSHTIVSTHPFINDLRFIGGKTGRTPEAGETMLTMMTLNEQPIAIIVIGSKYGAREWDTRKLLKQIEEKILQQ